MNQNRIDEALKTKKMTAAELSRQTGISKSCISRWISQYCQPRQETLEKIAKILDVDAKWLRGLPVDQETGRSAVRCRNRIKEALENKGMTAAELSRQMGVSKACISRWISQQWQPRQGALEKAAEILGVDAGWLKGLPVDSESHYLICQIDGELRRHSGAEDTEMLLKRIRQYLVYYSDENNGQ